MHPPGREGKGRQHQDHGHEDGADAISEGLDGCLGSLGFAHLPGEFCEPGIAARRADFNFQTAPMHQGASDDRIARLLGYRQWLAREKGLLHVRRTRHHQAVHGDGGTGPNANAIIGLQHRDRDFFLLAFQIQPQSRRRRELQQRR